MNFRVFSMILEYRRAFIGIRKCSIMFFCLLWTGLAAQNSDLEFGNVTSNKGLSHNTVYTITQSENGFMWFGTREGLNRFDGNRVKSFFNDAIGEQGWTINHIRSLLPVGMGQILVGSTEGLAMFDEKNQLFKPIRFRGNELGNVHDIIQNQNGSVSVATELGLFKLYGDELATVEKIHDSVVLNIQEFKTDTYWLITPNKLILINGRGEIIRELSELNLSGQKKVDLNQNLSSIFKDQHDRLWIGTIKNGLFYLNEKEDIVQIELGLKNDQPEANIIRCINQDAEGNIWVGTESGLIIYNDITRQIKVIGQSFDGEPKLLNDKAIYSIYRSKEEIMWVGTYFGGVNFTNSSQIGFEVLKPSIGSGLSGKAVSQIIQVENGDYWIGSEDGGITIWNKNDNTFDYLNSSSEGLNLSVNNVHAILENGDEKWIATFLGGVFKIESKNNSVRNFSTSTAGSGLSNDLVYSLAKDKNGQIWAGTQKGLNVYDRKEDSFWKFNPEIFQNKFIYDLYVDSKGRIWVGVINSGTVYIIDPDEDYRIAELNYFNGENILRSSNGIISILEDSKGVFWFGTANNGLFRFDPDVGEFDRFTVKNGLPNNYIYGILEDNTGNIWLSTNTGLSKYSPVENTFYNFDISYGLPNNQFNFKSYFKDREGIFYFGTINGLSFFDPGSLDLSFVPPKVYFSDFRLFNRKVEIGEKSILKQDIDFVEEIQLDYNQNVFTVEFGTICFNHKGKEGFAYKLEGFDLDWNIMTGQNSVTYTNLLPGKYKLEVKFYNEFTGQGDIVKSMEINVARPIWLSNIALAMYLVFLGFLIFLYRRFLKIIQNEKLKIQVERIERQNLEEINKHKLDFFTYISHEFKTPLTLIKASIDEVAGEDSEKTRVEKYWVSIRRNAEKLQHLIEQLMEFRKLETTHAKALFTSGDVVSYLKEIFDNFLPLYLKKDITNIFNSDKEEFYTEFDFDKLDKIFSNILSNAVKFVPQGGRIEMDLYFLESDGNCGLTAIISDSGEGISEDEMEVVFSPFYQMNSNIHLNAEGTGVGLALVKSLVDFLNGSIKFDTDLQRGTFITIHLPLHNRLEEKDVDTPKDLLRPSPISEFLLDEYPAQKPQVSHFPKFENEIFIVEDNAELRNHLEWFFNKFYRVKSFANGKEAIDSLGSKLPDLIISDVMMPKLDGIKLCEFLKNSLNTSHIPLILLSAKSELESRLYGLNVGAEAYLGKPFNIQELQLIVSNLLRSKSKLKEHFQKYGNFKRDLLPVNDRDHDFLEKIKSIVNKHLEDPDFNISTFTIEAGVSRTLLHTKIKKLMGMSATEFVKTIRLNQAANLLLESDLQISEVAYKVGFSDANYFSRSFKDNFLCSPSEYKILNTSISEK